MKKMKYINPVCVVVDMDVEGEILATSQTDGNNIGQKPTEGDGNIDLDVKGQGGNNLWEEW